MGYIIDINDRVSVEFRRESFRLTVGDDKDLDKTIQVEFPYEDATGILQAVDRARTSDQCKDHLEKRRQRA